MRVDLSKSARQQKGRTALLRPRHLTTSAHRDEQHETDPNSSPMIEAISTGCLTFRRPHRRLSLVMAVSPILADLRRDRLASCSPDLNR
jgi:hypothetical protein